MDASLGTETRKRGRPRLPTPERRQHMLASKAKWREQNREYYLLQKKYLASRPEYLARRRERRAKGHESYFDDSQGQSILECSMQWSRGHSPSSEATALGDAF